MSLLKTLLIVMASLLIIAAISGLLWFIWWIWEELINEIKEWMKG